MDVRESRPAEMPMSTPETGPGLSFERLVFFSDAVFAIVITLLVLPLTAEIDVPEGGGVHAAAVLAQWPVVLSFAVSFLVVGQFWIAHHRTFGLLARQDHTLVWLNLVLLLTVAFLPFPAALLGARTDDDAFPVVFYAASMTLTSAALTGLWLYASRRGLVLESVPTSTQSAVTRRALATTGVFVLSVPAALLGLPVAAALWLVVLPVVRTLLRRGISDPADDRG
jgi:uncharacterized membrane protein